MPEPEKFVESSETSLSVHLAHWRDGNDGVPDADDDDDDYDDCETQFFWVEQRFWF